MAKNKLIISSPFLILAIILLINSASAADPGIAPLQTSKAMVPASNLIYPAVFYNPNNPTYNYTELSITNTGDQFIKIKLIFVTPSCMFSDYFIELSPHQSFLITPETNPAIPAGGTFLTAFAVDNSGSPISYNYLVGSARVRVNISSTQYSGEYNAFGFRAIPDTGQVLQIIYDGINYEQGPATIALPIITSRGTGNRELVTIIPVGPSAPGTLFGSLYDDAEQSQSFQIGSVSCQTVNPLSNTFPRTTPRFEIVIPAGRTGWMKLYTQYGNKPILALVLHNNDNGCVDNNNFCGGAVPFWTLTNVNSYGPVTFGGWPSTLP